MSPPAGIAIDQARAHIGVLNLLLASPGLDLDTERRATWLKLRLRELVPEADADRPFDFTDARIAWLLSAGARRVAA
jgi:hypothetical protein